MIRRSVAGLVLGVALMAGSLAWSGFIALRTVLDPGRSVAVSEELYENEHVRDQLVNNLAGAFAAVLPDGVAVPREQLEGVAATVLEDPAVEAVITDAFVQTHAAFLGEGEAPRTLDATAIGTATRSALVSLDPSLDALLPAAPSLAVELPTDRVPDAGPLRRLLQAVIPVLALAAAAGVVLALVTTTDRPGVLRRAGVWAISTAAVVLFVGFGIPWLVERFAPDQAEVVAALVAVLVRTTLFPAVGLAAAGGLALVVALAWPERSGRRARPRPAAEPAAAPRPAPASRPGAGRGPQQGRPAAASPRAAAAPPPRPAHRPPAGAQYPPPVRPAPPRPAAPGTPPRTPPANPVVERTPARGRPEPRWVEGVGWVQHPLDEAPPEGGRWVPGVGYVLDDDGSPG